jgi:hypothetical protein
MTWLSKTSVLLWFVTGAGCAVVTEHRLELRRQDAIDKIAFDRTTCAAKDIQILRTSKDHRSIEVDACGTVVVYQDISDPKADQGTWINVTEAGRW